MPEDLKPKHDEFTAKVVNDPAKPQDSLLLQGFLGASSEPEHTRVYADMVPTFGSRKTPTYSQGLATRAAPKPNSWRDLLPPKRPTLQAV
jgi:hypothetical protein